MSRYYCTGLISTRFIVPEGISLFSHTQLDMPSEIRLCPYPSVQLCLIFQRCRRTLLLSTKDATRFKLATGMHEFSHNRNREERTSYFPVILTQVGNLHLLSLALTSRFFYCCQCWVSVEVSQWIVVWALTVFERVVRMLYPGVVECYCHYDESKLLWYEESHSA